MDNTKTLTDLGFTADLCTPQSPGVAALVYRIEGKTIWQTTWNYDWNIEFKVAKY
jgi:hypothetical protein